MDSPSSEVGAEAPSAADRLPLEQTYARLPAELYAHVRPSAAREPQLIELNRDLALDLGLDPEWLRSPEGVAHLAGSRVAASAEPLAMAYAGHQFGNFVPRLGDGRAILLGELCARDGRPRDLHLKGAGRTPFSRGGDGRAGLGPVLREFVVSEAMAALGIPTTRSLAMLTTGETIERQHGPEPGAVLLRTALGHVRVGTFEYALRLGLRSGSHDALRALTEHAIDRFVPEAREAASPPRALLDFVVREQAELVARWLGVGFIHGVMNTDNMSISCETIDYGPCAFMDGYEPGKVYSSIDRAGRYAYDQQPGIAYWNLARLAETLLPLLGAEPQAALESANEALAAFPERFQAAYARVLRRKLGLGELAAGPARVPAADQDDELGHELLACMADQRADFTLTFRALSNLREHDPESVAAARSLFAAPERFDAWRARWQQRSLADGASEAVRSDAMRAVNPAYIPRNHRIQAAIDALVVRGDRAPLDALIAVTRNPFEDHPARVEYTRPPEPHEVVECTFCGT